MAAVFATRSASEEEPIFPLRRPVNHAAVRTTDAAAADDDDDGRPAAGALFFLSRFGLRAAPGLPPYFWRYRSNQASVCRTWPISWLGRAAMSCDAPGTRTSAVSTFRNCSA